MKRGSKPEDKRGLVGAKEPNRSQSGVLCEECSETVKRRTNEMLAASDEHVKSIFEHALIGLYRTTPDGRILSSNNMLIKMLGFDNFEELAACNLEDRDQPPAALDPSRDSFKREIEEKDYVIGLKSCWRKKNGDSVHVRESARAVRDEDGQILYYEGTVEDITPQAKAEYEKRRLEIHLRQQQKLESLGTLASGVGHEINNPINVILNFGQLIYDRTQKGDVLNDYAHEIISESERIARIVSNLLAFSRKDAEMHGAFDVKDIIEDTMTLTSQMMKKDDIDLEMKFARDLPTCKCNFQQIQQVMMNLITNARDSLNERARIKPDRKQIKLSVSSLKKHGKMWLRVIVEDNGNGIKPEISERIFDPFFTTKPRHIGTGLGLSISHGIVNEHKGNISFESEPERFARFILDLPASILA